MEDAANQSKAERESGKSTLTPLQLGWKLMEAQNEIEMEEVQKTWCSGEEFTQIPLTSYKRLMDKALKSNERLCADPTVPATLKQALHDWQDVAVLNFGIMGILDHQNRCVHRYARRHWFQPKFALREDGY
ncbi:unnamed protein product [Gongylonema pulchrum]|uniref:SCP domain-containing protein n=1 Tax=Gongylonema pulchrum TaxID=637853 RepID=A0A183DPW2_9BILA|nr:unnamed protein product [Gongylonema pulchrum]